MVVFYDRWRVFVWWKWVLVVSNSVVNTGLPVGVVVPAGGGADDLPLYLVTHGGLTAGYQVAQCAHAVADIALAHPAEFAYWHSHGQRVVALAAVDAAALLVLLGDAVAAGFTVVPFREPDLGHEVTAVAFVPAAGNRKFLSHLSLAGRVVGGTDKHNPGVGAWGMVEDTLF